ncbi:MAG: type II toxin-antitoxin system HicB family antitoxin [Candidatus Riflebacteria bacterium]|nr:type II toxin-antitoxin system HicB family antitoxin [Candidatus Riflebacteria bacterium]
MKRYLTVIEKAGKNYSAYIPDIPGCVATGKTPEEVRQTIKEALDFHLEGLAEDGLKAPKASAQAEYIAV